VRIEQDHLGPTPQSGLLKSLVSQVIYLVFPPSGVLIHSAPLSLARELFVLNRSTVAIAAHKYVET
jgi:hypothetical protein